MRRSRVLVAAAGLLLGLTLLWLRVAWIQIVQHKDYEARAERNQEQRVLERPVRGALLDRYGRPLARDLVTYSVSAAARALAAVLHEDPRRLEHAFATRPRYLVAARHASPEAAQQIAEHAWRGV